MCKGRRDNEGEAAWRGATCGGRTHGLTFSCREERELQADLVDALLSQPDPILRTSKSSLEAHASR